MILMICSLLDHPFLGYPFLNRPILGLLFLHGHLFLHGLLFGVFPKNHLSGFFPKNHLFGAFLSRRVLGVFGLFDVLGRLLADLDCLLIDVRLFVNAPGLGLFIFFLGVRILPDLLNGDLHPFRLVLLHRLVILFCHLDGRLSDRLGDHLDEHFGDHGLFLFLFLFRGLSLYRDDRHLFLTGLLLDPGLLLEPGLLLDLVFLGLGDLVLVFLGLVDLGLLLGLLVLDLCRPEPGRRVLFLCDVPCLSPDLQPDLQFRSQASYLLAE